MSSPRIQIGQVSYNAAEQAFEAAVTIHELTGKTTVPARFRAPLATQFEAACDGLIADARRQMSRGPALRMTPRRTSQRTRIEQTRLSTTNWLQRILKRAA